MRKKVICLGILVIMCLGILSGCSGIWYNVAYNGRSEFGFNEDYDLVLRKATLIRTLNEMKALCDECNYSAYDENSEHYSNQVDRIIRGYDEGFFEKKSLIVYDFWGNESIKISSVRVEENLLIVTRGRKRGAFNDVGITWLFLIEVKKADIEGVTTVEVNKE